MRVRMRNGQMSMRVGMRLIARIRKVVLMLMMLIVAMPMGVFGKLVSMLMLLAHMQPNAERHQCRGAPKEHGRRLGPYRQRERHAE